MRIFRTYTPNICANFRSVIEALEQIVGYDLKRENLVSDGHNELYAGVEGSQLVRLPAGVPLRHPRDPQTAAIGSSKRPVSIPPASNAAAAASGARLRIQQA